MLRLDTALLRSRSSDAARIISMKRTSAVHTYLYWTATSPPRNPELTVEAKIEITVGHRQVKKNDLVALYVSIGTVHITWSMSPVKYNAKASFLLLYNYVWCQGHSAKVAVDTQSIAVNVDYRLAPETKVNGSNISISKWIFMIILKKKI